MADSSRLAGFLNRAEVVSELALKLGTAFAKECRRRNHGRGFVPVNWDRYGSTFDQYCQAILEMGSEIQSPPQGAGTVADWLKKAGDEARIIRNAFKGRDSNANRNFGVYMRCFDLNRIAEQLHCEVEAARKSYPAPDPFAFLDAPPATQSAGTDSPSDSVNQVGVTLLVPDQTVDDAAPGIPTARRPAAKADKGEGNGGDGSTPRHPATTSGDVQETLLQRMEPADRKAYYTYAYAESKLGDTTDRQAYQWLSDNGLPDESDSIELAKALADYVLPTFATWSKQLRNARKTLGKQKHTRRAGRHSGSASVVPVSELDSSADTE